MIAITPVEAYPERNYGEINKFPPDVITIVGTPKEGLPFIDLARVNTTAYRRGSPAPSYASLTNICVNNSIL